MKGARKGGRGGHGVSMSEAVALFLCKVFFLRSYKADQYSESWERIFGGLRI